MLSQNSSNKKGGYVAAKNRITSILFVGSDCPRNQIGKGYVGCGIIAKDSLDDLSGKDYSPRAPLKDRLSAVIRQRSTVNKSTEETDDESSSD